MKTPFHFVSGVLVLLLLTSSAAAKPAQWLSAKVTGKVIWNGAVLRSGQNLNGGDRIQTGRTGRTLLLKDRDRVIVTPNSRFQVPAESGRNYRTELFQYFGTMKYEIAPAPWRRFSVRTPYLAVVVKGTAFRIDISSDRTTVSVTEGAVQVVDGDTGERVLLKPGQAVSTLHRPSAGLISSPSRAGLSDDGVGGILGSAGSELGGNLDAEIGIDIGGTSASAGARASAGRLGGSAGASVGGGAAGIGAGVGLDF